MILYLNDAQIDFSLDQEKTLQDVIAGLKNFVFQHYHMIDKIMINAETQHLDELINSQMPLDQIETIEVYTKPIAKEAEEISHSLLELIETFILSTEEKSHFLKNKEINFEHIALIQEGIVVLGRSLVVPLQHIFIGTEDLIDLLTKLAEYEKVALSKIHDSEYIYKLATEEVTPCLESIKELAIPQIIAYYNFFYLNLPHHENKFFKTVLKEMMIIIYQEIVAFEKIIEFFQLGEDAKGIFLMNKNISLYEYLLAVKHRLEELELLNRDKGQEIQKQLMHTIKELTTALENNDTITICDLLEYEYFDQLKRLVSLFQEVLDQS